MLRNWRGRSGGRNAGSALRPNTLAPAPHSAPDPAAEISRLRRENDRLRMERDIKKTIAIFSEPGHELLPDRGPPGQLSGATHVQCAEVSPSGYYAWRSRPESARIANRGLLNAIKQVQDHHRALWGPRIHFVLRTRAEA